MSGLHSVRTSGCQGFRVTGLFRVQGLRVPGIKVQTGLQGSGRLGVKVQGAGLQGVRVSECQS